MQLSRVVVIDRNIPSDIDHRWLQHRGAYVTVGRSRDNRPPIIEFDRKTPMTDSDRFRMTDQPFEIRPARPADVPEVFAMLRELAVFEKLEHQLIASEDEMHEALFDLQSARALVAAPSEENSAEGDSGPGGLIGYAIFFENFSTFLCRRGLYLEDIYVRPDYRKRGVGKAFLRELARIAVERKCGRMEWSVLEWNQNAIDVYQAIGGNILSDWRIVRLETESIKRLAIG